MLLADKKFTFLTFANNFIFCSIMFLKDRTMISTIYLISLVEHLKKKWYFAKLQNLSQILSLPQHYSIRVPTVIPKTGLGKKYCFFETYHYGVHSLKQFLLFAAFFLLD